MAIALSIGVARPGVAGAAESTVTVKPDGQVAVEASFAPLAEVLERFARSTGARLTWEGAPARQLVSMRVEAPNAAAALAAILEGQTLNYALALDETGTRVALLIVGNAPPASASASSSGARPPANDSRRRAGARSLADAEPAADPEPAESNPEPPSETPSATSESDEKDPERAGRGPGAATAATPLNPPGPRVPISSRTRFPLSPFAPRPPSPFQPPTTPSPSPAATPTPDSP